MPIRPAYAVAWSLVLAAGLLLTASPPAVAGLLVTHQAHHFQIEVPDGWYVWEDLNVSGDMVDLMMRGSRDVTQGPVGGAVLITSESRMLLGSPDEAVGILREGIDNLSATVPGFRVVEPLTRVTVGVYAAATVAFWTQPSTYDVFQVLLVVTSAGWHRFWAVSSAVMSWELPTIGPLTNATLATFQVLPAPPTPERALPSSPYPWLLVGALVATAVEGGVLGALVLRQIRRGG